LAIAPPTPAKTRHPDELTEQIAERPRRAALDFETRSPDSTSFWYVSMIGRPAPTSPRAAGGGRGLGGRAERVVLPLVGGDGALVGQDDVHPAASAVVSVSVVSSP